MKHPTVPTLMKTAVKKPAPAYSPLSSLKHGVPCDRYDRAKVVVVREGGSGEGVVREW